MKKFRKKKKEGKKLENNKKENPTNSIANEKEVNESVKDTKKEEQEDKKILEELKKAQVDCEHWKNEYYKAYADMANLRKEIERDHKEAIKYRLEGFADSLLPILDGFEMALKNEPTTAEMKNYLIGFSYVYKNLLNVLNDEGVIQLSPKVGDKFDVKTMHAVETVDDEGEENIVKSVTLKGYKLHDHLIRAAMVVVSKHPSPKDVKEDEKEVKKNDETLKA